MTGLSFNSQKDQFLTVPCLLGFLGGKEQKFNVAHKTVYYKNKHKSKKNYCQQLKDNREILDVFMTLARASSLILWEQTPDSK